MKRTIRRIHAWLSIPSGLIITLICFSGAAIVFEEEIMQWCFPSRYYVEVAEGSPLPLDRLMEAVNEQLPDTLQVASVYLPADPEKNYRMSFAGQGRMWSMFVDPYSGKIKEIYHAEGNFFTFMRRLHRWLLTGFRPGGGFPVGKIVVGVATLLLVFILAAGMILWIIKWRKSGRRYGWRIKWQSGWKRLLYDLHIVGGMYVSLVLLVLALTGLTWSFDWYRTGFYKLFGAELSGKPGGQHGERGGKGDREQADFALWQQVAGQLAAQHPGHKALLIQNGKASVYPQATGNVRASDNYTFDPQTGVITGENRYANLDKAGKLRGWIYSVHTGSWGGWLTRIITCIASLWGASLPLTGYYLWWRKSRFS
ncbi:MAG: PepSY domain-containing protein [Tannerellaceae bacterium]|jgi:uncharacterized iron-regulated membrane protein|nr:PepSY domain-containing protein [Tannerellaceae bacterium]